MSILYVRPARYPLAWQELLPGQTYEDSDGKEVLVHSAQSTSGGSIQATVLDPKAVSILVTTYQGSSPYMIGIRFRPVDLKVEVVPPGTV